MPALFRGLDLGGTKLLVLDQQDGHTTLHRFPTGPAFRPTDLLAILATLPPATRTGLAAPAILDASGRIEASDVLPSFDAWLSPFDATLNDGEAALLAAMPADPRHTVTMTIGIGTGIASALQVNGLRLRTLRPLSGEFGHVFLGREAALDQLASGAAILKSSGLSPAELHLQLAAQDPRAQSIIREAGHALGLGLALLIQILHPHEIALYGGTLRYPGYLDAALAAVDAHTDPPLRPHTRIYVVTQPDTVVARGALLAAKSQSQSQ